MTKGDLLGECRSPRSASEAAALLAEAALPEAILEVAQTLHAAGYEVVLVGGAVRDFLLGRAHGDWDLASAATPEEVMRLFPKTIPTGIEHGTVTVICGRGKDRVTTEITTFRGEGGYTDGRRPGEVRFLRALVEDLARRDFTVNAMAFNPLTKVFTDVFGGIEDLRAGVIRAVGEAAARFREDGLRAMRAVRLCATLGYQLDGATAAAISGALDILDCVSRERVQVEMAKLLAAPRPSLGLWPMLETGMWGHVLADDERGAIEAAIEAVDRLPASATLRLARLLWPLRAEPARIEGALDGRLRPSREERQRVVALTRARNQALLSAEDPAEIRRQVAALGRDLLGDTLALLEADAATRARIEEALAGAALTAGELAIGGRDLLAEKIAPPGPAMGRLLAALLDQVIEAPSLNERGRLLAAARSLVSEGPRTSGGA